MTSPTTLARLARRLPGLTLLLLLATASIDAFACDRSGATDDCNPLRFRIGAGAGVAQIDEDDVLIDTGGNAYRVFAGYSISEHVGVELAALRFDDIVEFYPFRTPTQAAVADASGVSVAAVLTLPLSDRYSLLGRAGALGWSADSGDVDESGVDPMVGFAVEFHVTDSLSLGLSYDVYRLDSVDSRTTTAQIGFRF